MEMTVLERMIERVRGAKTNDEARAVVGDYVDPETLTEKRDDDGDTHVHVHLDRTGGGGGNDQDPDIDPAEGAPDITDLAGRVAKLEELVQQLMGNEEEEVELEDPETQDARRYTFRRGSKLKKVGDEGIPVPERNPEMMGETDLPGIEDLDKRMAAQDRRKAVTKLATRDSADSEDLWTEMVAATEILVPGMRAGTFDARLNAGRTASRMCAHRRNVLDKAFADDKTREIIAPVIGVKTADALKVLGCDTLKMAFTAAAAAVRATNNDGATRRSAADAAERARRGNGKDGDQPKGPPSIAEMNKQAKDFWKNEGNGTSRR
jgi:hypothetical protein